MINQYWSLLLLPDTGRTQQFEYKCQVSHPNLALHNDWYTCTCYRSVRLGVRRRRGVPNQSRTRDAAETSTTETFSFNAGEHHSL